tara:strand:+ start:63004 stop:63489 length:486 start_codon:yes stop_codon:yes gene_type:complete
MDYFTSLSESQIVGIILALAVVPFLFIALRRWWWAKQSVHWPKTKGIVIDGIKFRLSRSLDFLYTYDVNGVSYKGDKPFFYNSYKTVKKVARLTALYPDGKQVVVYYHPLNHKISTLEPGRKDGVNGALFLLLFLFLAGLMALSSPGFISEILDYFLKIIL